MKIIREDTKETKFDDVDVGVVFTQDNVVFMKTLEFYEIEKDGYEEEVRYKYNAIDLHSGEFSRFTYNDMVTVCSNAYLTIK